MTVEQSSLQQQQQQLSQRSKEDAALSQIKEVTGIEDVKVITEAISACCNQDGKYNIEDVVTMLVQDTSEYNVPANPTHNVSKDSCDPVPPLNKDKQKVIDLTNEKQHQQQAAADSYESEDIRKAIAASLQDSTGMLGGQVTREEQDISRVLEASLAETKPGTKRKRNDLWFVDPLNPYLRKREDWCPVGLKNVGNTCWFSALIQSLFHVNRFRHLLLNFQPRPGYDLGASNATETRSLRFTEELRNLFALMIGSYRKYVDPSKAVEILKEGFRSHTGVSDSQQDISEFQGKLLEWLEDAFKHSPSTVPESSGAACSKESKEPKNPMIELFYGDYSEIGNNKEDENVFLQFNLNVNGVRDVHESLEQETTGGSQASPDESTPAKEIWFNKLPPIMTFMLTRYDYNKQLQRSEKLHNKLEFPQVLFMDRYMHINKTETKKRREDSKKLREQLQTLQAKLDTFINYGSGRKRVPLQDVLQYALEFAESKRDCDDIMDNSSSNDVEMESPKPSTTPESMAPVSINSTIAKCSPVSPMSSIKVPNPSPRNVSESELQVLQDCLCRWRTEVENEVRDLQENIGILETRINRMYSDAGMQKYPYHLHAVLVHEGQTASGHYWAYIFDLKKQRWLKFNDITVTESTWEELEKESVGGYHNSTAYCLIYIDKERAVMNEVEGDDLSPISQLPLHLRQLVNEDNTKFTKELEDWDREQAKKNAASAAAAASAASDTEVTVISKHKNSQSVSTQTQQQQSPLQHLQPLLPRKMKLSETHAQLSFQQTINAVTAAVEADIYTTKGPEAALLKAFEKEMQRLENLAQLIPKVLPREDPRLDHILVYLSANKAPTSVIHRVLLEQFSNLSILDRDVRAKKIRQEAIKHEEDIQKKLGESGNKEYVAWHERYHRFRCAVHHFNKGVKLYHQNCYKPAMNSLRNAYILNTDLMKSPLYEASGLNEELLRLYRRKCLLNLNILTAKEFENENDVTETLKLMHNDILSSIADLSQSKNPADTKAVESMRNQWCTVLGQDFDNYKSEKLQDFFSKLFEPSTTQRSINEVSCPSASELQNLREKYDHVIDICAKHGFFDITTNAVKDCALDDLEEDSERIMSQERRGGRQDGVENVASEA